METLDGHSRRVNPTRTVLLLFRNPVASVEAMGNENNPLTVRQRDTFSKRPDDPANLRLRVVLDNLRSAFNVGSIFRTSEGAGVDRIHLCGITPYPPHPKLEKTARGATSLVAWSHHVDPMEAVQVLKTDGYHLMALELTDRSVDYRRLPYTPPIAIILGHEVAGVTRPVLEAADAILEIPMRGRKNSLNVATAAGIVLFEILRRWEVQAPDR